MTTHNNVHAAKHRILVAAALGAVLATPANAQVPFPFTIKLGEVVPSDIFAMDVTVLGCAIGYGAHGGYDAKVTLQINVEQPDGTVRDLELFGSFDAPVDGNINTGAPIRRLVLGMWDSTSRVSVTARSWRWDGKGNDNNNWTKILYTQNSHDNPLVWVLRDGDTTPGVPGFADQASAEDFMAPYLDEVTGTVKLDENQAIYLFELGTKATKGSAFDLQDAVVLVTLGESPVALDATAAARD